MDSGRRSTSRRFWLLASLAALVAVGCTHQPSADEATDAALKAQGLTRLAVYPLAGKVTIDGQVPQLTTSKSKLIVMLNDPKKPDVPALERRYQVCDPQGGFAFTTYAKDDGVPPGKFVVTIAVLEFSKKHGYLGPDQLKNLYNDPDKNSQVTQFSIDHQSPGKSDYLFNLEVAGKEAATPGPKALTQLIIDK
jgi:hypothetical protein